MQRFIQQHADQVTGVLSGFDRLRFRGTLRLLAHTQGMFKFLNHMHVFLKDFKAYAQQATERIRAATERLAKAQGRPLRYLDSPKTSKEETARQIAQRDDVREGLICILSAVESCFSYEIRRDAAKHRLQLHGRPQKCLHYYFYLQHPQFGFMHLELADLVPLQHPHRHERPRVAGTPTGCRGHRLSPGRQLLPGTGGPRPGPGTL